MSLTEREYNLLQRAKKSKLIPQINPTLLFEETFPQQRKFIEDESKLKMLWCTRRAGKSMTAAIYLIYEALINPGCNCLAIGLTRESIKSILWKDCLRFLDRKFNLKATFNLTELTMTLQNSSVIRITGVDAEEKEGLKLLGAKYRLVCIDEGSMYTVDLRNLVYGILKPAMTDPNAGGQRGTIAMMGTSSNYTRGLFFDIAAKKEPGWSLHTWTAFHNPYVAKQWQEELDEIQSQRPLYMQTPQFKQWYLNEYVVDETKLCYKFNESKNRFTHIPKLLSPTGWSYVLGIDLGYEDDTAFVLCAFHANDPNMYVINSYNRKHMLLPEVELKIKEYMVSETPPSRIIVDGSAKQAVETMRVRSSIPFEFAEKKEKAEFIELLNSDLVQGKILIHSSCTNLINEMMSLVWETDGERVKIPRKEHSNLPNHLCDALLYAWRMCYHYHSEPVAKVIPIGSKEWYQNQTDNIWERERQNIERAENLSDGSQWFENSEFPTF